MSKDPTGPKGADPFPARLREARLKAGLSQSELGQKTGLPSSSIAHFEGGARKPSFDNLRTLANALTVSTDFLLGRVEEAGHVAAPTDPLFRHAAKMSHKDRELVVDFMKMLEDRSKLRGDKS